MRALRINAFGALDQLRVEQLPDPRPAPGELVVRVRAASLNPSDAKNVLGHMEGTTLPRTPGRDFAGVVIEGPPALMHQEVWGTGGDLGFTRDGTHAELIVVPIDAVCRKPSNLSFEEAATVGVNFVAAWLGLIETAQLREGEWVLASGASGGVGGAVMQLAKWKGGQTVGVDREPMSEARQRRNGIDQYLQLDADSAATRLPEAVRAFTGGRGAEVSYDTVGGPMFEPCLLSLGPRGRQIVITSVGSRRVSFDLVDFYHRQLRLFGVDTRAYDSVASARILAQLTSGFEQGALHGAPIAQRLSLEQAPQAYAAIDRGQLKGKAVFMFSG